MVNFSHRHRYSQFDIANEIDHRMHDCARTAGLSVKPKYSKMIFNNIFDDP